MSYQFEPTRTGLERLWNIRPIRSQLLRIINARAVKEHHLERGKLLWAFVRFRIASSTQTAVYALAILESLPYS